MELLYDIIELIVKLIINFTRWICSWIIVFKRTG